MRRRNNNNSDWPPQLTLRANSGVAQHVRQPVTSPSMLITERSYPISPAFSPGCRSHSSGPIIPRTLNTHTSHSDEFYFGSPDRQHGHVPRRQLSSSWNNGTSSSNARGRRQTEVRGSGRNFDDSDLDRLARSNEGGTLRRSYAFAETSPEALSLRRSYAFVETSPEALSSSSSSSFSAIVNNRSAAAPRSSTTPRASGCASTMPGTRSLDDTLLSNNRNLLSSVDHHDDVIIETTTTTAKANMEIKKDGKPEECCICQEILLSDLVALVPCGHVMHVECARQCVQHGRKCPQCRAKMNSRDPFVKLYLDVSSYASSNTADVVLTNRLELMEKSLEARQKDLEAAEDRHKLLLKEHQAEVRERQRYAAQLKEMLEKYSTNIRSEHRVRMEMKTMEDAYRVAMKEKEDAVAAKANLEKKIHYLEVALDNKDGEVNRLRKQFEEETRKNQSMESLKEKRISQDKVILELGEKLRLQLEENIQLKARLANHNESAPVRGGFPNQQQQRVVRDFNTFRKRTYGEMNHVDSSANTTGTTNRMGHSTLDSGFHDEDISFEMTKRMSTPSSSSSSSSTFVESAAKKLKLVPFPMKITPSVLEKLERESAKFKSFAPQPGVQLTMKQMFSKRN